MKCKVDKIRSTTLVYCKIRSCHPMGWYGRFLIKIYKKGGECYVKIAVIGSFRQAKLNTKKSWHAAMACCNSAVFAVCP